jgi:RhtB (resistance to homoserine/threonine) family protein
MNLALLLTLASIHLAVVMSPGANFMTVTQNALAYSRRTGLLTVTGVATGSGLYITAGVIGFAAIISQSPFLFNLIRLIGAVYFLYLSYKLFTRKPRLTGDTTTAAATDLTIGQAYRTGLLSSIANPSAALYFLSLFTSFIPVSSPLSEKILAGVLLLSITMLWYALIAVTFSSARVRAFYRRAELWMNRFFGLIWLLLAIKLAVS